MDGSEYGQHESGSRMFDYAQHTANGKGRELGEVAGMRQTHTWRMLVPAKRPTETAVAWTGLEKGEKIRSWVECSGASSRPA